MTLGSQGNIGGGARALDIALYVGRAAGPLRVREGRLQGFHQRMVGPVCAVFHPEQPMQSPHARRPIDAHLFAHRHVQAQVQEWIYGARLVLARAGSAAQHLMIFGVQFDDRRKHRLEDRQRPAIEALAPSIDVRLS